MLCAAVIGLIGFGAYDAFGRSASRGAKAIMKALIALAMIFSLVVVTWDLIAGAATSTESLVVLIAAAPLLVGIAVVATVDQAIRDMRKG